MTREEAIEIIGRNLEVSRWRYSELFSEALEMAIEALSAEPTKEEKALLQKWRNNRGISMEDFEDAMNALQQETCEDCISRVEVQKQ